MTDRLWDLDERRLILEGKILRLHGKHNQKKHGNRSATGVWASTLESPTELGAMEQWSTNARDIRDNIAAGNLEGQTGHFMSAIEKAPTYNGEAYRGMRFKTAKEQRDFINSIASGRGFSEGSVSSFSKSEGVARKFAPSIPNQDDGKHGVVMKVKMKTSRDISSLNKLSQQEQEVLSVKGATYRLKRIDRPENKPVELTLEEL